jgi:hypothetical protein
VAGTAWLRAAFDRRMEAIVDRNGDGEPGESERGKRASFDPQRGEVHGSGSGAGGGGNPAEDFDPDPMAGGGADPRGGPTPADAAERPSRDRHQGQYG